MRVAVLGAGGKAGKELVKELLSRGHSVIAVGRTAEKLPSGDGVEARVADAADPVALAEAVTGADAVISALQFDVPATTILGALKQAGVDRLIVTGGAASLDNGKGVRVFDSPEFPEFLRPLVIGGIHFLDALRAEKELNWSFFSPAMTFFEGPRVGSFNLGKDTMVFNEADESKISYADGAIAMVDELEQGNNPRGRWTAAY
jgi:putative NADH-flavin reductase